MTNRRKYVLKHMGIAILAISVLLFVERVANFFWTENGDTAILSKNKIVHMKESPEEKTCLLIIDTTNEMSNAIVPQYQQIFTDMRVGFDSFDIADTSITRFEFKQKLENYKTAVIATDYYYLLQDKIFPLTDWVKRGGRLLVGMAPFCADGFELISSNLGIAEVGEDFALVDDFVSEENYMLGYQINYKITDSYESAMDAKLDSSATVYAHTSTGLPLVWTRDYGLGRFVVCNFSYIDKSYRGIYSSAYSLLEDVCVYPVINSSTFYLDDFPSPTPWGDGTYIKKDYGISIGQFYKNVWWPKVKELGEKHSIPYTGVIIETYEAETGEDIQRNKTTLEHIYYGKELTNAGGELGFHGYNHQPLCGPEYVYENDIGYRVWETDDAMFNSLYELKEFAERLFPTSNMTVYVPPSDILSPEGRQMIGEEFKSIRVIASVYGLGPDAYSQEFEVSEDGVIEAPRIVSSCIIDDYMQAEAFAELNFHFVNAHFMHPDDLLDEDRGAALGWEKLSQNLDDYMTWVDTSAPAIRHLTGSQMAGAIQRYVNVIPDVNVGIDTVEIKTDGFIDTAYYMIRVNDGELVEVEGGNLTKLNGTLFLLEANKKVVTITRK